MKRNKTLRRTKMTNNQFMSELSSRLNFANRHMGGWQYGDKRKLYESLGYPNERDLTFDYFFGKYSRQEIATTIIDKPVELSWSGEISVAESSKASSKDKDSLSAAWKSEEKRLGIKECLMTLDKIVGLGRYGILLFGWADTTVLADFMKPITDGSKKLLYIKALPENAATISSWEQNAANPRFGKPLMYKLVLEGVEGSNTKIEMDVHYSRLMHVVDRNLTSSVYGQSRLKPLIHRILDLDKILGGDAEMFWRGARPGYQAVEQDGFEMGDAASQELSVALDNYEHDLRRFIKLKGVDLKALSQQVEDPMHHVDAQLQAISAQTGIPKRILIGSERGELSSTQDKDAWLSLIKMRREEFVEKKILIPFIETLMKYGVIPSHADFKIVWEDLFAPSEKDKAEIGKTRAEALKFYTTNPLAIEILPFLAAAKYLLGLEPDQVEELHQLVEEYSEDDMKSLLSPEQESSIQETEPETE